MVEVTGARTGPHPAPLDCKQTWGGEEDERRERGEGGGRREKGEGVERRGREEGGDIRGGD